MRQLNIYLCGSITGIGSRDEIKHRFYLQNKLENNDLGINVKVFNPFEYFNYAVKNHDSEKEVMRYELNKLKKSDLIIVDFLNPNSLGTMSELAIAYDNRIPIIGYNGYGHVLHPWQYEMTDRIFNNLEDLIRYVINYYIV